MSDDGSAFLAGVLIGAFLVGSIVYGLTTKAWRGDLVERGLALYCPADGEFAFNDECVK